MTRPTVDMDDDELKEWLGITGTKPDVEKEVTYYTCLKMLSETIGKVPLKYNQASDCETEHDNDTHNFVDYYRDELSALWKWLYLDAWYL